MDNQSYDWTGLVSGHAKPAWLASAFEARERLWSRLMQAADENPTQVKDILTDILEMELEYHRLYTLWDQAKARLLDFPECECTERPNNQASACPHCKAMSILKHGGER
jgi:hypothetical protein